MSLLGLLLAKSIPIERTTRIIYTFRHVVDIETVCVRDIAQAVHELRPARAVWTTAKPQPHQPSILYDMRIRGSADPALSRAKPREAQRGQPLGFIGRQASGTVGKVAVPGCGTPQESKNESCTGNSGSIRVP